MRSSFILGGLLSLGSFVSAQQTGYGQCGGQTWTGPTTCVAGFTCVVQNPFYSQCVPGGPSTTTTTTHTTTTTSHTTTTTSPTTTTTSHTTTTTSHTTTTGSVPPAGTGFVSTASSPSPHFVLNGKPFYWGGTNAYFAAQIDQTDLVTVFTTMQSLGLTVVRVWMFNEVTAVQNFGAYYHIWNGATATINPGPNGFEKMDYVLQLAAQYGVKVILTLSNNWSDYGGSDLYVKQLGYQYHDQFFSETTIINAFKTYVNYVVTRYASNPTVFGWELMNEPRCSGSGGLPSQSSCASATITNWVNQISTYIKSIDKNHIVGVGDEGFFCHTGTTDFIYDCGTGGDSDAYSKLANIDFITFHMYPQGWSETSPSVSSWGSTWITQHAAVQTASGKPAILEEFGTNDSGDAKNPTYSAWYATAESVNLAGVAYWQLGNTDTEITNYVQGDSNTIFCPADTQTCATVLAFSQHQASKNT